MQILARYVDGSQTVLYEPRDRVELVEVAERDRWIAKVGDHATVIRREKPRHGDAPSSIDRIDIQTDGMREGGWGVLTVPPWFVRPLAQAEQNSDAANSTQTDHG